MTLTPKPRKEKVSLAVNQEVLTKIKGLASVAKVSVSEAVDQLLKKALDMK